MKTKSHHSNNVVISVENPIYQKYLMGEFSNAGTKANFVDYDNLVYVVAENPSGFLIVQSDSHELEIIEIAKKLKRLFQDEIKIIFLSSDYRVEDDVGSIVDIFIHYPVPFQELNILLTEYHESKKRILIVDDSKLIHKHLSQPLVEAGYEVVNAYDGEEGLKKAKDERPDLLISDIEMPKMNGFELCSSVRRDPNIGDIYIIMSSTLGSAADQKRGFTSGVDEYITKPVVIPELLNKLEKLFKTKIVGRENVLVVAPDMNVSKNATKLLTKQGFYSKSVPSLKAAIKLLSKMNFDLIITEAELPDGNAIELFKNLKTLPTLKLPAILVLTSQDNQAEAKMILNSGADGVIPKPFTPDSIIANVERAIANRRAQLEKALIEKYVSKASRKMAVEKCILSGSENTASARAYKKNATIFFSDIRNFTSRCEKYPPKVVVQQINTLFSTMTKVIMNSGGDIDKFVGDACMAFWMDENPLRSADLAILSTIIMQQEIKKMNDSNPLFKEDPLFIRFGLNTGEIILCDIGAPDARIDLTMIGDPVNLASRFESAAKQYGIDNLLSEYTIRPLLEKYCARLIDLIKVKGKEQPVGCYELLGKKNEVASTTSELVEAYNSAFSQYQTGNFDDAEKLFNQSGNLEKNKNSLNPSQVMFSRCQHLMKSPPREWRGVWALTEK